MGSREDIVVETDLLIVGTGPAGASLACFLSSHNLKGIIISQAAGTAQTPRAHITNMAALECLRDIGLEQECIDAATEGDCMLHTRWCRSMAGEEFARIYSWGNDPARKGDYDAASPCNHVDLPQTLLEPILVNRAKNSGFDVRFNTTFQSYEELPSGRLLSTLTNDLTGEIYQVSTRFLFGCDGARSQILRQLDIPLIKKPGQGLAINALVKADLSHLMPNRMGNLHYIMQPGEENPDFAWCCVGRMVKPWNEWMFILLPAPGAGVQFTVSNEHVLKRVKQFIGDDNVQVELLDVSKWYINEVVAEKYSAGNIFLLGDAVHRHPPFNGLGSNTCIQDAYNLAWKIAFVLDGRAGLSLLESYSVERQPVGQSVIARANQSLRDHNPIYSALGMLEPTAASSRQAYSQLSQATAAGASRRKALQEAVRNTSHEFSALGIEMNQHYVSHAIYSDDEQQETQQQQQPSPPPPQETEDLVLSYRISTRPGSRLPHAWLNTKTPTRQISTHDIAGHGRFTLLTGIGGESWREAAGMVGKKLGIEIGVFSIGWGQDFEDVYFDWAATREIGDDGCVLVRPDRFVAWRSVESLGSGCEDALLRVLRHVVCR